MRKTFLSLYLVLCAITAIAQTPNDSSTWNINLNEVVVEAPDIIHKADKQLYLPKKSMVAQSTDGADLLSKMKLPEIFVNKISGTITLVDNSQLTLCINGRPVDQEQIKTIRPEYVKRIEYHDHPSLRWGDAKRVIDFIIKNPESGGNVNLQAMQGINHLGYEDIKTSGNIYSGKSGFSAIANVENMDNFTIYRDNIEFYKTPDNTSFTRTESGKPGNYIRLKHNYSLSYNYTDSLQLFEVNVGHVSKNRTRDFNGILANSLTGESINVYEHNRVLSDNQTKLGFYYHRLLPHNQMLIASIGGNSIRANSKRIYTENYNYIDTRIRENAFKVISEINYEKQWKTSRFSTGLHFQQSHTNTRYPLKDENAKTNNNVSYLFAEYMQCLSSNMDITAGGSVNYLYTKMNNSDKIDNIDLHPILRWHWQWSEITNMNLSVESFNIAPNISQLSPVIQNIDSYQISVGNQHLKDYRRMNYKFDNSLMLPKFNLQIGVNYSQNFNPIMEYKYWNDDRSYIVNSYDNQKKLTSLDFFTNFRINAIKNWLTISGNIKYLHVISHGNDYRHNYNNFAYQLSTDISHWGFNLQWALHRPYNDFWGETESGDDFYNIIVLDYKLNKRCHISFIAFNPLIGKYYTDYKNLNSIAGYRQRTYCNVAQNLFLAQVNWNINWGGNKRQLQRKRISDSELDQEGTTTIGK